MFGIQGTALILGTAHVPGSFTRGTYIRYLGIHTPGEQGGPGIWVRVPSIEVTVGRASQWRIQPTPKFSFEAPSPECTPCIARLLQPIVSPVEVFRCLSCELYTAASGFAGELSSKYSRCGRDRERSAVVNLARRVCSSSPSSECSKLGAH